MRAVYFEAVPELRVTRQSIRTEHLCHLLRCPLPQRRDMKEMRLIEIHPVCCARTHRDALARLRRSQDPTIEPFMADLHPGAQIRHAIAIVGLENGLPGEVDMGMVVANVSHAS